MLLDEHGVRQLRQCRISGLPRIPCLQEQFGRVWRTRLPQEAAGGATGL